MDRVPGAGWTEAARRARPFVQDATGSGGGTTSSSAVTPGAADPYGYLVAPGLPAWQGLVAFLVGDGRALVMEEPFTMAGRDWPSGTLFLPRHGNDDLTARVAAAGLADRAVAVSTGLVPEGNDLGTRDRIPLELPRVALLTGEGVGPPSFGAHWFFLERTLRLPFDAVPLADLDAETLEAYDVVIAPDMWGRGGGATDTLKDWVDRGGALIAVDGAARSYGEAIAGIAVREEAEEDEDVAAALRGREQREQDRWEEDIPGTILPVVLDPANPLAYGFGANGTVDRAFVLHAGGEAFEPDDSYESVAFFPEGMSKISGVVSQENLELLSRSTWLATKRVGRGRVILFADDPLFRHFWYSAYQAYGNAVLIGPAM